MSYFFTNPLPIVDRPANEFHLGPIRPASQIKLIVLHSTAGPLDSSLDWLTTSSRTQVSAHRVIAQDGTIYKLANDLRVCHHVGHSRMGPFYAGAKLNCNDISLGIELVNRNDGRDPYEPIQVLMCAMQVAEWIGLYGYVPIVGHAMIDTRGKTDPAGFPWPDFYRALDAQIAQARR